MADAYPTVYVNHDGSVRDLSPAERSYLEQTFPPGDGNRPYIKPSHTSRTPVVQLQSGFLRRADVPEGVPIGAAHPRFDEIEAAHRLSPLDEFKRRTLASGRVWTENPDGTHTSAPDPSVSQEERVERMRRYALDRQLEREAWARGETL